MVGLEAHPEERTVGLIATPEASAAWIRPGVSAFLEGVVAGTEGPALAVPRSAVVQDGLTHVVFRRDPADPNAAIRVEADLGVSDGLWVVLQSGVARGDEVVVSGAYELKLATQQSAPGGAGGQKGGHVHADGSFHGDH
jgi:multidrug efflux pump subunit AcrA (membrane-fusion protein)